MNPNTVAQPPVPTEIHVLPGKYNLCIRSSEGTGSLWGHPISRHDLFNNWDRIRGLLRPVVGSWKRVDMVMEALRLQATREVCFASARYLAGFGFGNEKTWDRCLARLRKWGLVKTARTYRGWRQSVNVCDLRLLWRWVMKAIKVSKVSIFEVLGEKLWCKLVGWVEVKGAPPWIPVLGGGGT